MAIVTVTAAIFGGGMFAQTAGAEVAWIPPAVNAGGFCVVCWILKWFMGDNKRENNEIKTSIEGLREDFRALTKAMNNATIASLLASKANAPTPEMRRQSEQLLDSMKAEQ